MRLYGLPPMTNAAAWAMHEAFRADRRCGFADEPGGIEACWKKCAARKSPSPKMWMAAYLAAFAICGGHELLTIDKGFRQYNGLKLKLLSAP